MNLYDARSYFSQGFEDSLADPAELARQLEAHRMESEYVLEAIRELAYFATLRRRARELAPRAARTLAADTLLELVAAAGGSISYGTLLRDARRRHKMAGNRTERVFRQLEIAGVFKVTVDRADDSVTVTWGELLVPAVFVPSRQVPEPLTWEGPEAYAERTGRSLDSFDWFELVAASVLRRRGVISTAFLGGPAKRPRALPELRQPWRGSEDELRERPFSCSPDESAGLRELHEAGLRELEELRAGRDPRD